MARVKLNEISNEEKREMLKDLFQTLALLKDEKEMLELVLAGLTTSEIFMLSKRINIAKHIIENKSYRYIQQEESAGSTTIKTVVSLLVRNNHKFEKILKNRKEEIK
jgi:uncharacterized protein YerC